MRLGLSGAVVILFALGACASADQGGSSATKPNKEVAAGAAQLHGGGIRMDVQVGRPLPKKPTKNGAVKITPNATVTP